MSTVSTTINHGITLGTPNYYSPLTVTSTGYVSNNGSGQAVYGSTGTVVNQGTLVATGPSIFGKYSGIEIYGSGGAYNSGTIIATSNGIAIYGFGSVTNSGTISAQQWGVDGRSGFLYVSNTASIYGVDDGINLFSGGSVTNSGTIIGANGIAISGAAGTVVNSGGVTGTYQTGIALSAGGSVTNRASGVIYSGGPYTGVYVAGGAGTIVNSGTINGYSGVVFSGTYNDTLTDRGTIIGRGGTAVALGAGTDLMRFLPGNLLIQGTVNGGGATGTLDFVSGASIGTLTGAGAYFTNFGTATVDAGAQWVLAGSNTLGIGISLANNGTLTDTGTLINDGSIVTAQYGVLLLAPGSYLRNDTTGTITRSGGYSFFEGAVDGEEGSASTVTNLGTIATTDAQAAVVLGGGGAVQNGSAGDTSALIYGNIALLAFEPATVTNFGTIEADPNVTGAGVVLFQGGVVTNGAAGSTSALIQGEVASEGGITTVTNYGTITGGFAAIYLGGSGTIFDSGTIIGGTDGAIIVSAGTGLVVLEHGFSITGAITASSTGNVVELLGTAAAPVTADYNGLDLTNFQTAAFAPGNGNYATWTITNTAQLPGTIAGFTGIHDAIDLTTLSDVGNDASTSFNTLTNVLTVTGDNGSVQLQLDSEDYTGNAWTAQNDGSNGTEVTPLCFCAGTSIATPRGEILVERLGVGDLVLTASGQVRPIAWIGAGRVLATRGRRNAATPVIVRKGALGPNVPYRDLHVTKGHSFYLDGVLVPVEFLVNHRSILWDDHAQEVTLYHVELETHDVLVANGAPAESYRDDGNRWLFQNGNTGWDQPPKPPCADVLTGGPIVDAVWRRLLDRAGPCSYAPLTDDPDLHLLVDGRRLDATQRTDSYCVFTLPAMPRCVRVASRAAAPAELGLARDPRVLGVALWRIVVRAGNDFRIVEVTDDRLAEGFHGYEPDGDHRWTDGDALLPAAVFEGFDGPAELVLHVCGETNYRADGRFERTAA
jgi:hypothetical protein